ncbi:MAG: hypothetical protein J6X55_10715 [Victivallales bacterium]|nr:hypothetical protein [Victivallales bacterium]
MTTRDSLKEAIKNVFISPQESKAFQESSDINDLSPKVGERIECDVFGNGAYQSCTLESWTKSTFKAKWEAFGAKVVIKCGFKRSGKHCFYRTGRAVLCYQFIRDER